ncbi:MAG: glycosyltransferase family 39 protein [Saprospiraceae bacterium]|nr:glycosyltransferase family 39 protein [Saprospiraceae bacterium]
MSKISANQLFSNPFRVLGAFIGFTLLLRFLSFFPTVIDHDESTYIVIANALLHGKVYWKDVIDTKPIGIFSLFAIFQGIFGKSIFVIRLITALWIALSSWMIYLVHRLLLPPSSPEIYNSGPVASGILYILMTSIFTFYGVSPNTELFFVLFTITAIYLVIKYQHFVWFFLAGLLLGMGFMIKYVVLFDAIALGLFFIWRQVMDRRSWTWWLTRCFLMGFGFLLPLAFTWWYYRQMGMEETFLFFTFELSGRYFHHPPVGDYLVFLLDCFARYLPITFWFVYCAGKWRVTGPSLPVLSVLWVLMALIIVLMPGKFFGHYFIQVMAPMSLLAGSFFDRRREVPKSIGWMRKPVFVYSLLIVLVVLNMGFQKADFLDKKDYPKEVAAYLNTLLQPGDILYTGNYHHITYLLTGTASPTPYVHRSLLWDVRNIKALNIDQEVELNKILDQNPRFILIGKPIPEDNILALRLASSYKVIRTFDQKATVYERR